MTYLGLEKRNVWNAQGSVFAVTMRDLCNPMNLCALSFLVAEGFVINSS